MKFDQPVLNFVKGPTEETSQTKIDSSWTDVAKSFHAFKVNVEIVEGQIHYRDFHSKPTFDIYTNEVLHILAENLNN